MKIGFTGTQAGMTAKQRVKLVSLLGILECTELHHGDCVGADAEANAVALSLDILTIGYPCCVEQKRANCDVFENKAVRKPLDRNKDIVEATTLMIACPMQNKQVIRSGTWATIRHAKKVGKLVYIIYRNGSCILSTGEKV